MSYIDTFKWIGTVLFSVGSGGAIVVGLSAWLGKVWAQRLMEGERHQHAKELERDRANYGQDLETLKSRFEETHRRLQSELDKTIYAHQLRTQTEFNALMELWKKVPQLESAIAKLRPAFTWLNLPFLNPETLLSSYREALARSIEELDDLVDSFGPFVDGRIYDD